MLFVFQIFSVIALFLLSGCGKEVSHEKLVKEINLRHAKVKLTYADACEVVTSKAAATEKQQQISEIVSKQPKTAQQLAPFYLYAKHLKSDARWLAKRAAKLKQQKATVTADATLIKDIEDTSSELMEARTLVQSHPDYRNEIRFGVLANSLFWQSISLLCISITLLI